MSFPSKFISVLIQRPVEEVYRFASLPENMPKWAAGLSGSISQEDDHWISVSPMGKVKVYFTRKNDFGILDHDVILESGAKFHNPLRVFKNGDKSEIVFTLFRMPGVSEDDFNRDAEMVLKDLKKLKSLLE